MQFIHLSFARAVSRARSVADAPHRAKSLFFLWGCSNPNAVHVDSRLHFATSPLSISGGQHGEEEKESSSEEENKAPEEEVGFCRFKIFNGLMHVEDCFARIG